MGTAKKDRRTGEVKNLGGRPRSLKEEHLLALREIAADHPGATLEAVTQLLHERCGVNVCSMTVRAGRCTRRASCASNLPGARCSPVRPRARPSVTAIPRPTDARTMDATTVAASRTPSGNWLGTCSSAPPVDGECPLGSIAGCWSTPAATCCEPAVPGGCCPSHSRPGPPCTSPSAAGPRKGPSKRCRTGCASSGVNCPGRDLI